MISPLIPTLSPIKPLTWLIAIGVAVGLHIIFFAHYQEPQIPQQPTTKAVKGVAIKIKNIQLPATPPNIQPAIQKPAAPKPSVQKKPKPLIKPTPVIAEPSIEPQTTTSNDSDTEKHTEDNTEQVINTTAAVAVAPPNNNAEIKATYETTLLMWLARHKRYPTIAKRKNHEGNITLQFTIDKQGNVLAQKILTASPYESLNKATLKMIKRASPLPPVPVDLHHNKNRFTFVVPIVFKLQ